MDFKLSKSSGIFKRLYDKDVIRFLFMVFTLYVMVITFNKYDPTSDKYYSGGLPVSYYCKSHCIEYNIIQILISFLFLILVSILIYRRGSVVIFIYFIYYLFEPTHSLFTDTPPHPYYIPIKIKLFLLYTLLPVIILLGSLMLLKILGRLNSASRTLAFLVVMLTFSFISHFVNLKKIIDPVASRIRVEEQDALYNKIAVPMSIKVHYERLLGSIIQDVQSHKKIYLLPSVSTSYEQNLKSFIFRKSNIYSELMSDKEYQELKKDFESKAKHIQRSCDTSNFINTLFKDIERKPENSIITLPSDFTVMILYAGLIEELNDYNNWESNYSCGIAISDLTNEIVVWAYIPHITIKESCNGQNKQIF
jgi:hypothetical protein